MKTIVRVISIATDSKRRVAFRAHAEAAKVDWRFFDACTSLIPDLVYQEDRVVVHRGRPMSRGELGCFSSHYSVWKEFLEGDADQLIVMEDDILVDWPYFEMLADHDFAKNGIHYLRFASLATPPAINKGEFLGRYLVQFVGYALGSQAYLLTREGAEYLIEYVREVRGPIDDMLDQSWRGSLPNLALYQHPVIALEGPSNIGAARNKAHAMPMRLKWRRFLFRVDEKLRRKAYTLAMWAGFGPRIRLTP